MRHCGVARLVLAAAALLASIPLAGWTRAMEPTGDNGGPTLDCRVTGLRIGAAEVSGARFVCRLSGVLTGDTSFTVRSTPASADVENAGLAEPVCAGNLSGGAGGCVGSLVDRANSFIGPLRVDATLEPSGATLGPISLGAAAPAPAAPMQFFPLGD